MDDFDKESLPLSSTEEPTINQYNSKNQSTFYDQLPQAIPLLDKPYSLEPDLMFGWKPKVSQPLPLPIKFSHAMIDYVIEEIYNGENFEFKLVYLGPRLLDTLDFHNHYSGQGSYPFHFDQLYTSQQQLMLALIKKQRSELKRYVQRPFVGQNPKIKSNVHFNSNFESGNLDAVIEISPNEYDLFMRVDTNTKGNFKWFYFTVKMAANRKIRLNICNFTKERCLYQLTKERTKQDINENKGMKPYICSSQTKGIWQQGGEDVQFYERKWRYDFLKSEFPNPRKYYTLSFTIESQHDYEEIKIAYSVPYTFTQLTKYLNYIQHMHPRLISVTSLGKTLSGLDVPLLTIKNHDLDPKEAKQIVVSARIHPGEANGSWVCQGLIDFLLSDTAKLLREKAIFQIVPMMNPDGVIAGNYRTGAAGRDLNRQFKNTDKVLYPTVHLMKTLMKSIKTPWMYLDLHGHSSKKNVFMYGPEYPIFNSLYYQCRVLPKLLSQTNPLFRYWSGVWRITAGKRGTSRALFYQQYNMAHCFVVETSNGGYYLPETMETIPFQIQDWLDIGQSIGKAIKELLIMTVQYEKYQEMKGRLNKLKKRKISDFKSLTFLTQEPNNLKLVEIMNQIAAEEEKHNQNFQSQSDVVEEVSDSSDSGDENVEDEVLNLKKGLIAKNLIPDPTQSIRKRRTISKPQIQIENLEKRCKPFDNMMDEIAIIVDKLKPNKLQSFQVQNSLANQTSPLKSRNKKLQSERKKEERSTSANHRQLNLPLQPNLQGQLTGFGNSTVTNSNGVDLTGTNLNRANLTGGMQIDHLKERCGVSYPPVKIKLIQNTNNNFKSRGVSNYQFPQQTRQNSLINAKASILQLIQNGVTQNIDLKQDQLLKSDKGQRKKPNDKFVEISKNITKQAQKK